MSIIEGKNIHRKFGKGDLIAHVLKGIDITIEEGEFVAIMGKSGAGKSTLMYQLSALDEPTEGSILVDGTDVVPLHEKERTSFRLNTLGYVFQDYALVPDLSARENVMMPLLMRGIDWEIAGATADSSLDAVGLEGKYPNLPGQLSGGEQQRVAVARALAGKPKIIFADEPTANLDSVSGQAVIDLFIFHFFFYLPIFVFVILAIHTSSELFTKFLKTLHNSVALFSDTHGSDA
jgi:putative ABC transport system ATP-binding protein